MIGFYWDNQMTVMLVTLLACYAILPVGGWLDGVVRPSRVRR